MDRNQILSRVDHTLLAASAAPEEIFRLCAEAVEFQTASVCIPPASVRLAAEKYPALNIGTVIGFPLGYSVTGAKAAEIAQADKDGASEFDMVINIGWAKAGLFEKITEEIKELKALCPHKILKVIIETCYLSDAEKTALCGCVMDGGADYIKTSTGFGTAGAALADILLFRKHTGGAVKIKAAGGIRTRADMEAFIEAGCDRLGTSSALKILMGGKGDSY